MSSEDKAINITEDELREQKDFWDDIIRREDGTLSEEHLYQELHDFRFIMNQACEVYYHITCGALSKPGYFAKDVISVSDNCLDSAIREVVLDVLQRLEDGETISLLREEFNDE